MLAQIAFSKSRHGGMTYSSFFFFPLPARLYFSVSVCTLFPYSAQLNGVETRNFVCIFHPGNAAMNRHVCQARPFLPWLHTELQCIRYARNKTHQSNNGTSKSIVFLERRIPKCFIALSRQQFSNHISLFNSRTTYC